MSAEYTYDGDGNRVKSEVTDQEGTHTTGYLGDHFEVSLGTPIEPQIPSSPNCSVNYCVFFPLVQGGLSVPAGHAWESYYSTRGQRVAMRVNSNQQDLDSALYYFLTDHLGSTTVTLDAGGNPFSELRYDPWGKTRYVYENTPTTYRYTGQREAEAGLYDYQARLFAPTTPRSPVYLFIILLHHGCYNPLTKPCE